MRRIEDHRPLRPSSSSCLKLAAQSSMSTKTSRMDMASTVQCSGAEAGDPGGASRTKVGGKGSFRVSQSLAELVEATMSSPFVAGETCGAAGLERSPPGT